MPDTTGCQWSPSAPSQNRRRHASVLEPYLKPDILGIPCRAERAENVPPSVSCGHNMRIENLTCILRDSMKRKGKPSATELRNRRPAQCRQEHHLQRPHLGQSAGRELSLL